MFNSRYIYGLIFIVLFLSLPLLLYPSIIMFHFSRCVTVYTLLAPSLSGITTEISCLGMCHFLVITPDFTVHPERITINIIPLQTGFIFKTSNTSCNNLYYLIFISKIVLSLSHESNPFLFHLVRIEISRVNN